MANDGVGPNKIFGDLGSRLTDGESRFAIDDRMYEDIGEDFDPSFIKPKRKVKKKDQGNPFLLRDTKENRFVQPEERTLESLRKEWEHTLKPEEEKVQPLVTTVIKVDKRTRADFVSSLKRHMDSIEDFMLKEIAPLEVALADSLDQAKQKIELITESEVDLNSITMIQSMLQEAIRLKTFDFLCEKLGLPPQLRQVLIDKYFKADARKP